MSEKTLTQTETKESSKEEVEEEEPLWKKYQRAITEHEEWTVETLVVVDKIMYYKHGKDNITTFTLTLFNMVKHQYYIRSWIYRYIRCTKCMFVISPEYRYPVGKNMDCFSLYNRCLNCSLIPVSEIT